jgi:hypothetical protein
MPPKVSEMEPRDPDLAEPLPTDEIETAAVQVAAEPSLEAQGQSVCQAVRRWGSPSLVACLKRDASVEDGWRVVSELCSGPLSAGFQQSFARQIEETAPQPLEAPKRIPPPEDFDGMVVKPRDTWLIPWSTSTGASGIVLLRGMPRPYPANIADATARLCEPLWPQVAAAYAPASATVDTGATPPEPAPAATPEPTAGSPTPPPDAPETSALSAIAAELSRLAGRLTEEVGRAAPSPAETARLEKLERELGEANVAVAVLRSQIESLEQARQAAEEARSTAHTELAGLKERLDRAARQDEELASLRELAEKRGREAEEAKRAAEAGEGQRADLEEARQQAERAREAAEAQVEELKRSAEEKGPGEEELARLRGLVEQREREAGEAREAATAAEQKLADLEQARKQADDARAKAEAELEELKGRPEPAASSEEVTRLQALADERERELSEERSRATGLQERLDALERTQGESGEELGDAKATLKKLELALAYKDAELEESRRHIAALERRTGELDAEKKAAEGQQVGATVELQDLRSRLADAETRLQLEVQGRESAATELEATQQRLTAAEQKLSEAPAEEPGAAAAAEAAVATGAPADWKAASDSVVGALAALRRTPFVPPMLRIAFGSVEEAFGVSVAASPTRVLLLDRNVTRLEGVAAELEKGGLTSLIAHYPEEISFFLKMPEGDRTTAIVCDVMAFRPEQDLLDLFRLWRRDVPSLTIVLCYQADNPAEQERVVGVPTRTAGRLPMPLTLDGVTAAIRKAQATRGSDGPPSGIYRPGGGR